MSLGKPGLKKAILFNDMENFIHDIYGYCFYVIEEGKKPLIFNLYTEPKYRTQGFARKHIKYVIKEIRETGYNGVIEIENNLQDNVNFRKLTTFYRNMGLKIINSKR